MAVRITAVEVVPGVDVWITAVVGWTKHAVVQGDGARGRQTHTLLAGVRRCS
jgi:hypothetical protein